MGFCENCGSLILFGAKTDSMGLMYCDDQCLQKSDLLKASEKLPTDLVQGQIERVYKAPCPECAGTSPVDIHFVHTVWSAVVYTSWRSRPVLCCRQCATKAQVKAMTSSLLLGIWGLPLGPIMTVVQAGRNFNGIIDGPPPAVRASKRLQQWVRVRLAEQYKEVEAQTSQQRRKPVQ